MRCSDARSALDVQHARCCCAVGAGAKRGPKRRERRSHGCSAKGRVEGALARVSYSTILGTAVNRTPVTCSQSTHSAIKLQSLCTLGYPTALWPAPLSRRAVGGPQPSERTPTSRRSDCRHPSQRLQPAVPSLARTCYSIRPWHEQKRMAEDGIEPPPRELQSRMLTVNTTRRRVESKASLRPPPIRRFWGQR